MQSLKSIAKQIGAKAFTGNRVGIGDEPCPVCHNTGTEIVTGKGARSCERCVQDRNAKYVQQLLDARPLRYRNASLQDKPRPDLHADQPEILKYMRNHPEQNYYLCGKIDTGKTHLLYALYAEAVKAGRPAMISTLEEIITKIKEGFKRGANMDNDWLRIDRYRQTEHRHSVFIDDIAMARPTEFVAETFFALIDALYVHKHQIVVTSQLDPEERIAGRDSLIEHFEKSDPRYALGIVRRLVNDEVAVFRMF